MLFDGLDPKTNGEVRFTDASAPRPLIVVVDGMLWFFQVPEYRLMREKRHPVYLGKDNTRK